jgi:hypothetical protein
MTWSSLLRHLGRLRKHVAWILVAELVLGLVRTLAPESVLRGANEVGGNFFQTFGGMYGIILAFVFYVVWQQHLDTQVAIEKEAVAVSELHRLLRALTSWAGRAEALERLARYARGVPLAHEPMKTGQARPEPVDEHALLNESLERFLAWRPEAGADERLFEPALELFHEVNEAREHRVTVAQMRLPEGLRAFVVLGGVCCVLVLDTMWIDSWVTHALYMAGMTWVVVAAISIVQDLDDPYTGDFIVDWSRFRAVADRMAKREEP